MRTFTIAAVGLATSLSFAGIARAQDYIVAEPGTSAVAIQYWPNAATYPAPAYGYGYGAPGVRYVVDYDSPVVGYTTPMVQYRRPVSAYSAPATVRTREVQYIVVPSARDSADALFMYQGDRGIDNN